jgi:hypothetical protein
MRRDAEVGKRRVAKDWICRWDIARRTSRRNKLEVMRHRRVVDEGVCDHVVGVLMSDEEG